jgi:glycosyltransferase involved in cell wall biosynthesis
MQRDIATLARRALIALARRAPLSRGLFRAVDDLREGNAALTVERDRAIAERNRAIALQLISDDQRDQAEQARWQAVREREAAEQARWQAVSDREEAEKARWQAVSDREEAEKARWAAIKEREVAERARWTAVRQREEADAARRQAALGYQSTPKQETVTGKLASDSPPRERTQAIPNPTAKLNGGGQKAEPGATKISIVLPNYNHGALIRGNIEAVRAQTYPNWELVIVDDGSTDDSRATIVSLAKLDERITPIFLPENRGVFFALQTGLAATTGELLYGSAADDYIANDRFFELVIAALVEHPEAAGAFGKAVVIDAESGKELWRMGSSPVKGLIAPQQALESFLVGGLFVPGAAAIWKRSLIDALGGFDPSLGPQTDYFVNHALPAVAGAVFIDEVFVAVRGSGGSYHRSANEEEFFRRHALVESKLRALNLPSPLDPVWLRIWRDRLINSRLAVTRQQQIFDSLRATLAGIEAWERDSLPVNFFECSSRVLAEIGRLESELEDRVSSAHLMLDALAGPLELGATSRGVLHS